MGKPTMIAALAALWAVQAALAPAARAAADPSVQDCAKRTVGAAVDFATNYLAFITECEAENLGQDADEKVDCRVEAAESNSVAGLLDRFFRAVDRCDNAAFRSLCPFTAKNAEQLVPKLTGDPSLLLESMLAFNDDIFVTDFGPPCVRPPGEADRDAEECGDQIGGAVQDLTEELLKCLFKCELGRLREGGTAVACIDRQTGAPIRDKVVECFDGEIEDFAEAVGHRCEDQQMFDLGCPMDSQTVDPAVEALEQVVKDIVLTIDNAIFDSPCKTNLDQVPSEDVAVPANVTLEPSFIHKTVSCGQVLGQSFFGNDTVLKFDTDLDCTPIVTATDGIVIAKSGVTVSGRGEHRITGPQSKSNRTGTGIRLASGAENVQVHGFTAIERFGVGVGDAGDNGGLEIESLTARRNEGAGFRLTSPDVTLEDVKSDRNVNGFELSGDDTVLKRSRALRSIQLATAASSTGFGIILDGDDDNDSGCAVRVSESSIEENFVGVLVKGGRHCVEDNSVRMSLSHGIRVTATGAKVDSNSVKLNQQNGIVVSGGNNEITANTADENIGDGFDITGTGNFFSGNKAGSLTDNGNGGAGYRIRGVNNSFLSNRAEANLGPGFRVEQPTAQFKSNDSNENTRWGFTFLVDIGTPLDTNTAARNGDVEFRIVAGNEDAPNTNRANGVAFSFGGTQLCSIETGLESCP